MVRIRSTRSIIILRWRRSPLALYLASILFAIKGGILSVIWPWQIMGLGGTSVTIGAIGGLWVLGYVLSCLLTGPYADRLGPRRLVMSAAILGIGLVALMFLSPYVWLLLALIALDGVITGMMWPPIMGWLSTGQDGYRLNKRMGMFGVGWAFGSIAGMWVGGPLWGPQADPHSYLAFGLAACASLGTFFVAAVARKRHPVPVSVMANGLGKLAEAAPKLPVFRRMTMIAGIVGWMSCGVVRYPVVSLMKDIGLGPETHGRIASVMTVAFMCGLYLMGKTIRWHYKGAFLWGWQIITAAAVCAVGFSTTGWELLLYSAVLMLSISVCLGSDLYYSLSGSTQRSATMAWREIRLSLGFAAGSFGGGFLADWVGLREIYPIMAGIIVVSVVIQAIIYHRDKQCCSKHLQNL